MLSWLLRVKVIPCTFANVCIGKSQVVAHVASCHTLSVLAYLLGNNKLAMWLSLAVDRIRASQYILVAKLYTSRLKHSNNAVSYDKMKIHLVSIWMLLTLKNPAGLPSVLLTRQPGYVLQHSVCPLQNCHSIFVSR